MVNYEMQIRKSPILIAQRVLSRKTVWRMCHHNTNNIIRTIRNKTCSHMRTLTLNASAYKLFKRAASALNKMCHTFIYPNQIKIKNQVQLINFQFICTEIARVATPRTRQNCDTRTRRRTQPNNFKLNVY